MIFQTEQFFRTNNYVTCVSWFRRSYSLIVSAARRNLSTCLSLHVRPGHRFYHQLCRRINLHRLLHPIAWNVSPQPRQLPHYRRQFHRSVLDDKMTFGVGRQVKELRRIETVPYARVSKYTDGNPRSLITEKNVSGVAGYVENRIAAIAVTDRYLYLFTLSYHIRKSNCKHFSTLMSTLHHRSSLTLTRAPPN